MGRTIDADVLKAAFEMDGYKSPYVARMIDSCPTVKAQAEWISLQEHPPTENGRYLVTNGIETDIGWYSVDHAMFFDGDGVTVFAPMRRVTHWMEMPKAKKRMQVIRDDALHFLYKQLKDAKIAIGRAENRPGVTREELDNLERKIAAIDWMIPLVINAEDENVSD